MGLSEVRHTAARWSTSGLASLLAKAGATPNALTVMGCLISVAAAVVVGKEYLLVGGVLVLFSGAFDLLDGPVARASGKATTFGAVLDSVCDRLGEAAVLLGVLVLYLHRDAFWEPVLVYSTLVGSVLVSYIRARAEGLGLACEVGVFTRAERVVVLTLGLFLGEWIDTALPVALGVLTALTFLTVGQRLVHVWRISRD